MAFAKLPDADLGFFAGSTIAQMTDNPGYLDPRVPLHDMLKAKNTYVADMAAAVGGGRVTTATKNASRAALIMLLRQQAAYVQSIAGADLALLLSSGFLAASTNRARMLLPQAVIKSVKSIQSTMFSLALEPVRTARGYEVRYKTANGEHVSAPVSSSSRGILLKDLVPGFIYTIQARAIGGLTGCGDWSDPISRMAV
ncbi:MAG TPA: fibronectin type III domain-containing protein [Verrucomicrobiae bacterium]